MTVRGDDVQHFAGNAVLVRKGDATERMAYLLPKFSLNHFARCVFVVLQRFAHVSQQRAGDEVVALNWDAAAEGLLEDIGDRDALPCAWIEMLDEGHVDIAGQQCELDRAQVVERPALSAATGGNRLVPNRRDLFAQRLVLDLPDARKELRDFGDAVDGRFVCFHGG